MNAPVTPVSPATRPFQVGTTGWTLADLTDLAIADQWEQGRYEIVEGVLTTMPAAYFFGNVRVQRLILLIQVYLGLGRARGEFAQEVDVVLSEDRVVRADAVFMTPEDDQRQQQEIDRRGDFEEGVAPIFVPPTLIIESLSRSHERHDRGTKRRWYAEARIPNYWLLNTYQQTLECLALEGHDYRVDQAGSGTDEIRPSLFSGLVISLTQIWQ